MITNTSTLRFGGIVLALMLFAWACSIATATNYLEAAVNAATKEAPLIESAYNLSPALGAKVNAYFTAVDGCLSAAQTAEAVPGSTPASIFTATASACSADLLTVPSLGTGVPGDILIGLGLVSGAVDLYLTSIRQAGAELSVHPELSNSFAGKASVKAWKHMNAKQLEQIKAKLAALKAKLR